MADDIITKEDFFRTLYNLDSEDDSIHDGGRLASESFIRNSTKAKSPIEKDSSALNRGRGSSHSTEPTPSDQGKQPGPLNTPQRPFTAQNVQRTVSAPLNSISVGSSDRDGNSREWKAPPSSDRASHYPQPLLQLKHTISAPIQTLKSPLMSSSNAIKASGKRKRDSNNRRVPEGQRIFKDLHFCTA
jgi:hypothetical protein